MGSKPRSGWTAGPSGADRVVLAGSDDRNVDLMTNALTGYDVAVARTPADLDPVLSGAVQTGLVVVDTDDVTEDVTALVDAVLDRDVEVLLLASAASPTVREQVDRTPGLSFREKPIRDADLRTMVGETFN